MRKAEKAVAGSAIQNWRRGFLDGPQRDSQHHRFEQLQPSRGETQRVGNATCKQSVSRPKHFRFAEKTKNSKLLAVEPSSSFPSLQ